jgi:hypothetical protein
MPEQGHVLPIPSPAVYASTITHKLRRLNVAPAQSA